MPSSAGRSPAAQAIASVDLLSGGRLVLIVGAGFPGPLGRPLHPAGPRAPRSGRPSEPTTRNEKSVIGRSLTGADPFLVAAGQGEVDLLVEDRGQRVQEQRSLGRPQRYSVGFPTWARAAIASIVTAL